jgi:hypothetical protein
MSAQEHGWYHLNVNEGRPEVIHRNPPTPQCNEKMMEEDIIADVATIKRMVREGKARYCQHCW